VTPPRVTLTPAALSLSPGQTGAVAVEVTNLDESIVFFETVLVGLPPGSAVVKPEVLRLEPDRTGTVQVTVTVPAQARLLGGEHVLGVLVRSQHAERIRRCEELRLSLAATPGIRLTPAPQVREAGAGSTTFALRLENDGNTAVSVRLRGEDPKGVVGTVFRPSTVDLPAGSAGTSELVVSAPRAWTGQVRRHVVTVHADAGPGGGAQSTVTFEQKPRVAGGVAKFAGVAIGLLLVLAALPVTAAVAVKTAQRGAQTPTPTAAGAPSSAPPSAAASSAPPSAPASSAAPSSAAASPSAAKSDNAAFPPGKSVAVDFTVQPDGSRIDNRIIAGDAYAKKGVTLSTVVDRAPQACAAASGLALVVVAGRGGFLTSALPGNAGKCNVVPIRLTLAAPAGTVSVTYFGTGKAVRMTVEFEDGTTKLVPGNAAAGVEDVLRFVAPTGQRVAAVVFGTANPDPETTDGETTQIRRLTFIPA